MRVKSWPEQFLDAASHGQLETAQQLLQAYAGARDSDDLKFSLRRALQAAAGHGHEGLVGFLLDEGATTDAYDKETPALIRAVEAQSLPIVKLLLHGPSNRPLRRAAPISSFPPDEVYAQFQLDGVRG